MMMGIVVCITSSPIFAILFKNHPLRWVAGQVVFGLLIENLIHHGKPIVLFTSLWRAGPTLCLVAKRLDFKP